jgi:hypothetical protein
MQGFVATSELRYLTSTTKGATGVGPLRRPIWSENAARKGNAISTMTLANQLSNQKDILFNSPAKNFGIDVRSQMMRGQAGVEATFATPLAVADTLIGTPLSLLLGGNKTPQQMTSSVISIGAAAAAPEAFGIRAAAGEVFVAADTAPAVSIGKSGYSSIGEFADAATAKYQALYDQGYGIAQQRAAQGIIPNTNLALGSATDEFARVGLRDWVINTEGLAEGPGEIIQINRRLYDPTGSGAYRIPDVHIPGAQTILDGSLSFKVGTTPQIRDFSAFSGGSRTTIIAPNGLRWGSYGIVR